MRHFRKRQRFAIIALGSGAVLGLAQVYLKSRQMEPLIRYLIYFVVAKIISDIVYYVLAPERQVWLYPEQYLRDELLSLGMYGLPVCLAQRYMVLYAFLPYEPVMTVLDSWAPLLALCLVTRWKQEDTDDNSFRPGRRINRAGPADGRSP